jgi:ATP synthase protein I
VKLARRHRIAALTTTVAGVVAVLVGFVAVGGAGPLSALVGLLLVLGFLSAGSLPLLVAGDGSHGRDKLGFLVLGTTYALRLVLAIAVLTVADASGSVDSNVMGLTVIACALVWTATQVVLGSVRRHQPGLEL